LSVPTSPEISNALAALGGNGAVALIARYVIAVGAAGYVMRQVRKPNRLVGRPFLWMMNVSHSPLTTWGLSHVAIGKDFTILDVGCGGGATVERLAAIATDGHVSGVDYAEGSVAVSRRKNARLIAAGRADIQRASVSQLPFADQTYDLVTAIETHYYWPDVATDMREIRRVLKPGGALVIVAESYRGSRFDAVQRTVMKSLGATQLSVEDHRALFVSAGYSEVQMFEDRKKGWVCGVGRVPATGE
jgi:SAM-dependent methyltransferase